MYPIAAGPRHQSRRPSPRHSFSNKVTSKAPFESPRTLCPPDTDAFSYNPAHLEAWYMPSVLWDVLPESLRKPVATFQHAGAAVITGFDRLADTSEGQPDLTKEQSEISLASDSAHHHTLPLQSLRPPAQEVPLRRRYAKQVPLRLFPRRRPYIARPRHSQSPKLQPDGHQHERRILRLHHEKQQQVLSLADIAPAIVARHGRQPS